MSIAEQLACAEYGHVVRGVSGGTSDAGVLWAEHCARCGVRVWFATRGG